METENPRLGFIGMGGMGSRMAARLLAAGYDITIYNRNRERTRLLEKQGASVAAEPGELAAHVDIVLSSLADDVAVENVMLGPDATLARARPGTVFIEMSTVSPSLSPAACMTWHSRRACSCSTRPYPEPLQSPSRVSW